MKTVLDTSDRPAHDALVEKKSKFIADVCHVDALDEALLFVDSVRQLHPKARHVAYAAICVDGDGRVRERMSDDGEPSSTPLGLRRAAAGKYDELRSDGHPVFRWSSWGRAG